MLLRRQERAVADLKRSEQELVLLSRCPEPNELMDEEAQVRAYAEADFEVPHIAILDYLQSVFPELPDEAKLFDIGCGAADLAIRLARLYPDCTIDAADGAKRMLNYAAAAVSRHQLRHRIRLLHAVLPCAELPALLCKQSYDLLFSNSLLHHLRRPEVLWDTLRQVARPGTRVFVSDLKRPDSRGDVEMLVRRYADDEPAILRRDFFNSLIAAFTPDELKTQLFQAGLEYLEVREISDRHQVVYGSLR